VILISLFESNVPGIWVTSPFLRWKNGICGVHLSKDRLRWARTSLMSLTGFSPSMLGIGGCTLGEELELDLEESGLDLEELGIKVRASAERGMVGVVRGSEDIAEARKEMD
jgi:hypothetical protein